MKLSSWILSPPPILNDRHGRDWALVAHDKFDCYPLDGGAVRRNTEAMDLHK